MTPATGRAPDTLSTALYIATKTLHMEAETTGIIRHLLRGQASRDGYVLMMRNLLPAYRALEQGLADHRDAPLLADLAQFDFDRSSVIDADLVALAGPDYAAELPLLTEAEAYAARISEAAHGDGARLIAHAYTRYLGDLSGGQILRKLLGKTLGLRDPELSFYDFPRFSDLVVVKNDYRAAIDRAGANAALSEAIVAEGSVAFIHNIAMSCAVDAHLSRTAAAA